MLRLMLAFLITATAQAQTHKTGDCEDSGFVYGPWQDLSRIEPKVNTFLGEIAELTGQTGTYVDVTNCVVKWPVDDEDQPLAGVRNVIIDKVWYTDGKPRHYGMKIVYELVKKGPIHHDDGSISYFRNRVIYGLSFCRTPDVCKELAIPFGDPKKKARVPKNPS